MNNWRDIFNILGGCTAVADRLGLNKTTVYRWMHRGFVPMQYFKRIKTLATISEIKLSYEDMISLNKKGG